MPKTPEQLDQQRRDAITDWHERVQFRIIMRSLIERRRKQKEATDADHS